MEGNDIKVTKLSKVSKTPQIDVPENLEMEARMLIDLQAPVFSIKQAKISAEKTLVSVEGKVTEVSVNRYSAEHLGGHFLTSSEGCAMKPD